MSAKYKSPSFLLPNELNTSANTANDTGINSLYSMNFDGTNYIDLGDSVPPFNQTTSKFSISFWLNRESTTTNRCVFENRGSSYNSGVSLEIRTSTFYFWIYPSTGGGFITQFPTSSVPINQWKHIAIVFDGTQTGNTNRLKIYVDNSSLTLTYTNNVPSDVGGSGTGDNFRLAEGLQANFQGKIDEFAIFNRALNTTEIAALYDGTGSNIRPSNLMAANLNPIAYYPLGEQAQNTGKLPQATANVWQFPNGVLQDYVMDFDGVDDLINLDNGVSLNSSGYSLSIWFNSNSFSSIQVLFTNAASNIKFVSINNSTTIRVRDGVNQREFTIPSLNTGLWYNLIIVVDNGNCQVYLNSDVSSSPAQTVNQNWSIDAINGYSNFHGGSANFNGKLSNAQIFNTALPATGSNSVETLYNNGSPLTLMSGFTSLTNWWKLNATSVYTPSAPNYTTAVQFDATPSAGTAITWNSIDFSSSFTISGWFNAVDAGDRVMFIRNYSGTGFVIYVNTNYITVRLGANFGYLILAGGTGTTGTVNEGFNHVIFQRDYNSEFKVYLNGQPLTMTTPASGSLTQDMTGNLISGANNTSNKYTGQLSNAVIYNSFLSSSQVSTLFNFGTPETNISFTPNHWWKLNNVSNSSSSDGLFDNGSGSTNGTWNNTGSNVNTSVVAIPSWKIPSALPITTTPNYTTALDFDGNDYIDCGSSSNLELQTISVSFWIKETQSASSLVGVVAKNIGSNIGWMIWVDANQLIWQVGDGSTNASFTYSKVSNFRSYAYLNQWNNICCTFDGTDAKIYINNVLHNVWTPSSPFSIDYTNIGNLNIGKRVDRTTPKLNASLSNVSIFNSTLTASQVSTLYNGGTPETAISFSPVSWWKLDTGGSTITDYGSGGNNGTNNGTATQVTSDVLATQPVNGVSTTLPSTALQQSDLQFDSPYSNYSLSFDGAGDYIDTNYIFPTISTWSYSYWVNITDPGNSNYFYQVTARNSSTTGLIIWSGNGSASSQRNFTAKINSTAITFSVASFATWYNVVITGDGSNLTAYVDGTQVATTAISTLFPTLTYTTKIGSNKDGTNYFLNGKIDETSIFNYALSSAQVLEIYNNGKPGDLDNFSGTAPISWWRLGENAYFNDVPAFTVPNSISGAPNGTGSGSITTMISADAPGTYANGIGTNLDIIDRVGDAPLSTSNSQSYNMIPSDISPYVPQYVGDQIANNFSMTFDPASNTKFEVSSNSSFAFGTGDFTTSLWAYVTTYSNTPYLLDFRTGQTTGMAIYVNTSGIIQVFIDGSTIIGSSGTVLSSGWRNIIVKRDNGTLSTHIDGGSADQSVSNSTNLGSSSNPLVIGARFNSTTQSWPNKIDEVAIFDTALNAGQIYNDIYQPTASAPGNNQTADLVNNPNLPNPVAWYRMGD